MAKTQVITYTNFFKNFSEGRGARREKRLFERIGKCLHASCSKKLWESVSSVARRPTFIRGFSSINIVFSALSIPLLFSLHIRTGGTATIQMRLLRALRQTCGDLPTPVDILRWYLFIFEAKICAFLSPHSILAWLAEIPSDGLRDRSGTSVCGGGGLRA